jgi:hypothetical protein
VCGWRRPYHHACPPSGYQAEDQAEGKIVEHNPDEGRDEDEGSDTKSNFLLHIRESPVPRLVRKQGSVRRVKA